jgi:hypothetical protein
MTNDSVFVSYSGPADCGICTAEAVHGLDVEECSTHGLYSEGRDQWSIAAEGISMRDGCARPWRWG